MSASSSGSLVQPDFSVRLVVCDHYLTKPTPGIDVIYSDFRGSDIKQVPVLRIFGSAADGHKACLHIHGVFPYFYIPCPMSSPEPQFLYQIAASLDKALNIALKQATSANQHVYKISLVKGLPFYGFHDKVHLYLKVFLYNPGLIKQAVELCSNGAILGQTFQPHESHLNFTLQFFIDFNLFGMTNVDLQTVKFRRSGISQNSNELLQSFDDYTLKPESSCYYEADCIASQIINRQRVGKGDGIENPGLEEVWNQEKERRKQLNVSMASKSLSQGRIETETESHYRFEKMIVMNLSNLVDKPVDTELDLKQGADEVHYYPAESMEGTQLFNAVDISMHLPENTLVASLCTTLRRDHEETLIKDIDNTIVDENVALNSSLSIRYSQVLLDNKDFELVDMLQDMDVKPIEEDSVMGTPGDVDKEAYIDSDDAEYSQAFNEETLLFDPFKSKGDADENSPSWNDSFWDGVNIPQLDGTFDDDHVKKVRKRKMKAFKLGLSKFKSKKTESSKCDMNINDESGSNIDESETEEINASRETVDSTTHLNLKINVKKKLLSVLEISSVANDDKDINIKQMKNQSVTDLVNKINLKSENVDRGAAEIYDLQNKFLPMPGPSTTNNININCIPMNETLNSSFDSSCNDNSQLGIMSFYDTSKILDHSLIDKSQYINLSVVKELYFKDVLNKSVVQNNKTNIDTNTQPELREASKIPNSDSHKYRDTAKIVTPRIRPPTKSYIISSLEKYKMPKVINFKPYFSNFRDTGDKVEIGQMVLKLQSKLSLNQKPFGEVLDTTSIEELRQLLFLQTNEMCEDSMKPEALKDLLASNNHCVLEPVKKPPTRNNILKWLEQKHTKVPKSEKNVVDNEISKKKNELDNSQAIRLNADEINSSTSLETNDKDKSNVNNSLPIQKTMQPDGSFLCFWNSETQKDIITDAQIVEVDFLTVMLLEVHTSVRGEIYPDPAIDPIKAIFFTVTNDCPPNHKFLQKSITQIVVVDHMTPPKWLDRCVFNSHVSYVNNETELLERVIQLVKKHDPDIICGYEIEMNSWGYVFERSQILGIEMVMEISRITEKNRQKRCRNEDNNFEDRVIGRVLFNVWRLFRHELALSSYSFESCLYEIIKERAPKYSYAQLAEWWNDESRIQRWIPVEYYLTRLSGTVRMLEKLDIINRTSELARLFGLQWWEVLSRGSQFRVESLMLRAARPLNLVALSPTVRQRAAMRAPECLPLILEPESRFYSDPIIVLDFQSLYPSMMIAYNYCFSTCIGRVQHIRGDSPYEFGAWRLRVPKSKLDTLVKSGLVHWSPVGVGFVKTSVRRGVLPALLRRILAARQAVKKGMKLQTDEAVKKAMHSRQLGLKLIANVTYGYTAANFSGRMPCVELGDSVVAKGRETLERAIKLVRDSKQWNAKVVYGDTDSMFVQVPGGSRAEAFRIGQQIADAVTADNPAPVALKLEKVYQPCILQTKKRYVGYVYESPEQETPVYEAKGIETVRRDGCPAGVKLLRQCLCALFDHGDVSRVKRIAMAALARLAAGAVPAQDLLFTREFRGVEGYRASAAAPPLEIAKRLGSRDRRRVPRAGERVAWQVCAGAPHAPLATLARTPAELARDSALAPHVPYYATRALLPPLHRCMSLLGVDVFKWWCELSYTRDVQQRLTRGGIARYMSRERCAVCGARGTRAVCEPCAGGQRAALAARLAVARECAHGCEAICGACGGHAQATRCENTECPVLWRRLAARHKFTEEREIMAYLPSQFSKESLEF